MGALSGAPAASYCCFTCGARCRSGLQPYHHHPGEFGLLGQEPGAVLFNYVIHERISKSENFNLERIMRITVQRT